MQGYLHAAYWQPILKRLGKRDKFLHQLKSRLYNNHGGMDSITKLKSTVGLELNQITDTIKIFVDAMKMHTVV